MPGHDDETSTARRLRRALVLGLLAVAVLIFRNRRIAESEANLPG